MQTILFNLFGSYTPVTYQVPYEDTYYEVIPQGLAGVDWTYILGIGLFAICLYSVFRIIGSIISRV